MPRTSIATATSMSSPPRPCRADKIVWYENLNFAVVNTNDSGPGSLRHAIQQANASPGVDTITFAIGSGYQTIALASALPTITDSVIIDGTTQPGYAGHRSSKFGASAAGRTFMAW